MTAKEIERAKSKLPHGNGWWDRSTKEEKKIYAELACRTMINSILVYGWKPIKDDGSLSKYLRDYSVKGASEMYYVGEQRVRELIAEQEEDFKKATVSVGAYTDYEGCTYNSCDWGD